MSDLAATYPRTSGRERFRGWRPEISHAVPQPGDSLPPGPRTPVTLQSLRLWGARHTYFPAMQARFGDIFSLSVAPMGKIVVVCGLEDARRVAFGAPGTFPVGENNALFVPLLGRRSVLVLDGAAHRSERKRLMPALHGERIAGVVSLMEQLTEQEVSSWPVGSSFSLMERMRELTLRVIIRVVMGVEERDRADQFVTALHRVVGITLLDWLVWAWPQLARVGPWRGLVQSLDHADALMHQEIDRRRRDPHRRQRPDVLSMLLDGDADDQLVRDELVTLLTGGHETTAVAVSWMFERLLRHPAALARVRAGLDAPKDEYRTAVIKETLRSRSVNYNLGRRTSEPVELGGYRLPAGTFVWPSIDAVHSDRRIWGDDVAEFRPERWLEPGTPERAFFPFGGGAHHCLGAVLAQTEMEVILRTVLRRVDLQPDRMTDEGARMRNIMLVPRRGARARVTRRISG
jgi:cytochrome P450